MFKLCVILATVCFAAASAGHIQTHHVVEPALAKIGHVVHSSPSAFSHQSITQVHSKNVVHDVIAPVLKTTVHHAAVPVVHAAPVVHSASVIHSVPEVHSYSHSAPVLKTYQAAPVVHSVHSAPLVHHISAPVHHVSSPVAYSVHH